MKAKYAIGLGLSLVACGDNQANNAGIHATSQQEFAVTVSGAGFPHILSTEFATDHTTDFTQMSISLVNPARVLQGDFTPLVQSTLVEDAACAPAEPYEYACEWMFNDVDLEGVNLGLVAAIDDLPEAPDRWLKTGTGIAAGDKVLDLRASGAALTNALAFAVSHEAEAKLALFVGKAAGALEASGFVVGRIVTRIGTPVGGAMLQLDNPDMFDLYYLNDDLQGVNQDRTSAAHGLFLAVPKNPDAAAPNMTHWGVQGASGTWTPRLAGTTKGTAFVLVLKEN